ncbi:MAG: protein serine/threonine phosphatase [Frankiales bacterium]|nr:protein serine/threonine phosphatase [Frankiales bacterium]
MVPAGESALIDLLADAGNAAPHELGDLINSCALALGAEGATAYMADLQQHVLMPFTQSDDVGPLNVDATLAGRAFQTFEMQLQEDRVWLPLVLGTDRIGVLCVIVGTADLALLQRLATTAATLLASKTVYGDTLVKLRRVGPIGLAAEMQYSLLPPLAFASREVTVSAALEPCYNVAGDTIDYAVDRGRTSIGVFDGMGHGLHSAQCASLTVATYRNARRGGQGLPDIFNSIDVTLQESLGGEAFTTAVLAELDTDTGLLSWVNAGHPEPLLMRGGKVVKTLYVEPRPPLGLGHLVREEVEVGTEQLEPGDRILVFTDGVVEARSPGGDFFGVERLGELVVRHLAGGLPAAETMRRVVRELLDHQGGQLSDDASLLLLEWRATS